LSIMQVRIATTHSVMNDIGIVGAIF
jgi:hypothetical protein